MSIGLIGRKLGVTQVFQGDGTMVAVSVLAIGPNTVTRLRTEARDGYTAAVNTRIATLRAARQAETAADRWEQAAGRQPDGDGRGRPAIDGVSSKMASEGDSSVRATAVNCNSW